MIIVGLRNQVTTKLADFQLLRILGISLSLLFSSVFVFKIHIPFEYRTKVKISFVYLFYLYSV